MAKPAPAEERVDETDVHVNEVRLMGRVSAAPERRLMPSGDEMWQVRVVVHRPRPIGKQSIDVLDCVAWSGRSRRSVSRWGAGDEVEISGALRRRFFRGTGRTESRTEVEIDRGRIVRRARVVEPG